ncbi:MAG: hypothetical protein SVU32_01725, partial [Candidatus Nanohaloarchaea archaeon]|nr:hypothetical protein [Candidatus Nanohaloarchaea archaeon]
MGKISQFIVGLFVIGAGYVLRILHETIVTLIGTTEAAPIDAGQIMQLASWGFMGLGALLVAWAVTTGVFGLLWKLFRSGEKQPQQPQQPPQQRRQPPANQSQ